MPIGEPSSHQNIQWPLADLATIIKILHQAACPPALILPELNMVVFWRLFIALVLIVSLMVLALISAFWLEARKPSHFLDPVTRFIRENGQSNQTIKIAPGLFRLSESRYVVETRLTDSRFRPAKGTPFANPRNKESERWFRRDQFLALWHFNVDLRFNEPDGLVSAEGMFAGPTFK